MMILQFLQEKFKDLFTSHQVDFVVGRFYNDSQMIYFEKNGTYTEASNTFAYASLDITGVPSAIVGGFSQELTVGLNIAISDRHDECIEAIEYLRSLINAKRFTYQGHSIWLNSSEIRQLGNVTINQYEDMAYLQFTIFAKLSDLYMGNNLTVGILKDHATITYAEMLLDTVNDTFDIKPYNKVWVRRALDAEIDFSIASALALPNPPEPYFIYYLEDEEIYKTYNSGSAEWINYVGFVDTGESIGYEDFILEDYSDDVPKTKRSFTEAGNGTIKNQIVAGEWSAVISFVVKPNSYLLRLMNEERLEANLKRKYQLRLLDSGVETIKTVSMVSTPRVYKNGLEVKYTITVVEVI